MRCGIGRDDKFQSFWFVINRRTSADPGKCHPHFKPKEREADLRAAKKAACPQNASDKLADMTCPQASVSYA
jgi:hypothetical protein